MAARWVSSDYFCIMLLRTALGAITNSNSVDLQTTSNKSEHVGFSSKHGRVKAIYVVIDVLMAT